MEGESFSVSGDRAQLQEAVSNVVSNAIAHNRPGGSVTISTCRDNATGRVQVTDTGTGIPAAALPHVFDRFFRVDAARGRDAGGAGLGLSVAQAIVRAHGGEISCSSEEGIGSVFVVRLPLDPGDDPPF